jgi:hypothetical protein
MSPLRATAETIAPALQPYRQGAAINVPPEALYRLSLEHLHSSARLQFMRQVPQKMPADPHQVFFTAPGGFAAHAIQWHPFAFSARAVPEDIGFDCHTIDCRFAADLTRSKDRASVCYVQGQPPQDGYIVGLDSAQGLAEFGSFEVSPAGMARSLAHWISTEDDFDYFTWVLRQRALYTVPPKVNVDLPADCVGEEEAIADTIAAIERLRPEIMDRIRRYAP